jgi:hypothetical protein
MGWIAFEPGKTGADSHAECSGTLVQVGWAINIAQIFGVDVDNWSPSVVARVHETLRERRSGEVAERTALPMGVCCLRGAADALSGQTRTNIKGGAKIDHETPDKRRFVAVQK